MDADRRLRVALLIFGLGSLLLGATAFATEGVDAGTALLTLGGVGLVVYTGYELIGPEGASLEVGEDRNWVLLILVTAAFLGGLLTIL